MPFDPSNFELLGETERSRRTAPPKHVLSDGKKTGRSLWRESQGLVRQSQNRKKEKGNLAYA